MARKPNHDLIYFLFIVFLVIIFALFTMESDLPEWLKSLFYGKTREAQRFL